MIWTGESNPFRVLWVLRRTSLLRTGLFVIVACSRAARRLGGDSIILSLTRLARFRTCSLHLVGIFVLVLVLRRWWGIRLVACCRRFFRFATRIPCPPVSCQPSLGAR
jgi:hypothetical protein